MSLENQTPGSENSPEKEPVKLPQSLLSRRLFIQAAITAGIWGAAAGLMSNLVCNRQPSAPGPRQRPEKLSVDPEVEKFLAERFEAIAGTASFEDAKVVGLGELHFRFRRGTPQDRGEGFRSMTALAVALQRLARPGDHVLVEGVGPERGVMRPSFMIHPSLAFIERQKGIQISGWDKEKLLFENDPLVREHGKQRNVEALYPSILSKVEEFHGQNRPGRIFVLAGVAHFTDDRRIDAVLEKENIPYLLLGERSAVRRAREWGLEE